MSKRTRVGIIGWLSAAALAARTAAERSQDEGPRALENTSSVRIIRKHSSMPGNERQQGAAPVRPVVTAGLQDDARGDAVLRQEQPEPRGDPVQTVDVLGAGTQVSCEGGRLEMRAPEDHPDVVGREGIVVPAGTEDPFE